MTVISPPIDDDAILAVLDQHRHPTGHINSTSLAEAIGRSRSGVQGALARLAREGRIVSPAAIPGFAVSSTSETRGPDGSLKSTSIRQQPLGDVFEPPDNARLIRVSANLDPERRLKNGWEIYTVEPNPLDLVEAIKKAFADYAPAAPPTPLQNLSYANCLTLYILPDLHVGMFSWSRETDVDWDLKIAERAICETMDRIHLRTAPSERAVVLVGGDVVHSDTRNNTTERSGNPLQVDGRYDKVIEVAQKIVVRSVELALHKHRNVLVRVLKGNHDYHTSVAVAHFLRAWYRNDPRVEVDISPSLFWFHLFEKNFIAAHHGHETKAQDMPMKMACARPELWSAAKHRYAHIFHWHHAAKTKDTFGGVIVEKHEAPCPQDDWHYGKSFLSGRSLCSITYDPERGESGRVTENL